MKQQTRPSDEEIDNMIAEMETVESKIEYATFVAEIILSLAQEQEPRDLVDAKTVLGMIAKDADHLCNELHEALDAYKAEAKSRKQFLAQRRAAKLA